MTPQTGPSLQYVLVSLPNKTVWRIFLLQTIRECLERCKICLHFIQSKFQMHWYKLNWSFKKKSLCLFCRYTLSLVKKVVYTVTPPPRTPNLIWLEGHHPTPPLQINAGGWQVWRTDHIAVHLFVEIVTVCTNTFNIYSI